MNKEVSSKVIDDAREKIAKELYYLDRSPEIHAWQTSMMQERYYIRADKILALSGTTDIECPECEGSKKVWDSLSHHMDYPRPKCNGTGIIKHPWEVKVE